VIRHNRQPSSALPPPRRDGEAFRSPILAQSD